MASRKITTTQLLRCLRQGRLTEDPVRDPVRDLAKGGWKCTVEHYTAGESVGVAVAIESIRATGVTVITVYHITY
jgi:hypothetical protein